ncbi:MAG: PAS domain S-box-containing protein, partial [Gammaproteobacteria bacterium]
MAAYEFSPSRGQETDSIATPWSAELLIHLHERILVVDADGRIRQASTSAAELFDIELSSLILRTLDSLPWIDNVSKGPPSLSDFLGLRVSAEPVFYNAVYINASCNQPSKLVDLKVVPISDGKPDTAIIFINECRVRDRQSVDDQILLRCFDVVQNSAEAGIWEWEPSSGRFREFGLWRACLGYCADESCNTLTDLVTRIHPNDREEFERVMGDVSLGRTENFKLDCRQQHKNGTYRWFRCAGEVTTRDDANQPILVSGTQVEISELKETAAQLQSKELELNLVLEGSRQGVWEWNARQNLFTVSETWKELFGYTQSDIHNVSHDIDLLMHPDDHATWKGPLRDALKGELDVYESEQRLRHKAGHYLTCLNRGRVLERDAAGRAVRVIGTHIDITQSQLTQNELRESNERLNIALENAHQGIWEWYPDTNIYWQYGYLR